MTKTVSTLALVGALVIGGTVAAAAQTRRYEANDQNAFPSYTASEGRSSAFSARPESFDLFPGESSETGMQDGVGQNPQGIGE